ncbi:HFR058Wp [Eremothecium sinecaudum]|uniref:Large ribosomal subunit protein bL32m n=1 Tax=Eremothecium sinecaudum TaxID=45286 RepID=A0A109UZR2_9SACH|nr:HFR058Wp [Eremothecium sinecaudum]AMD21913.1 HFR058Wp [Eremothecium sinecaudum]
MSVNTALVNIGRVLSESAVSLLPCFHIGINNFPSILPQALIDHVQNEQNNLPGDDFFFGNGMILAAPKKKVSHAKKRQRLYAPGKKQLKMIHHLGKCPSCGHYKRMHTLCMHCFNEIRHIWKMHTKEDVKEPQQEQELSELDKRILYPGKKETEYIQNLKDKDSYLERRMRTLPVERKEKK